MGLMRHVTVVSGSSIYLPAPDLLPLRDLPLLGSIEPETSAAQLRELLGLCAASQCGGALRVVFGATTAARVRALGEAIAATLRSLPIAASRPLVLLVDTDAGKALGHYATAFGAIAASVVVVDEIDASRGRFLRIGASQQQVVPVSFFGMG
jgi:ethanolamine utilization protein EutA